MEVDVKEIFAPLLRALVDSPDELVIDIVNSEGTLVMTISTAEDDSGKVIGKQGRIADSLRTLLNCVMAKHGKRAYLEIKDFHLKSKRPPEGNKRW